MFIDLTQLIINEMPVYPGDSETQLIQSKIFEKDQYSNHELSINMHVGTHIDGPMHLTNSNVYLSDFPIDTFIGEACLIDVCGKSIVDYIEDYEQIIKEGSIVILYTGHSKYFGQSNYFNEHPVLTNSFAELIVRKKVKMLGMDTPSPDKSPFEIHKLFFENNILIIENLTNLERLLNYSTIEITALPIHIKADSSLARVIAKVQ